MNQIPKMERQLQPKRNFFYQKKRGEIKREGFTKVKEKLLFEMSWLKKSPPPQKHHSILNIFSTIFTLWVGIGFFVFASTTLSAQIDLSLQKSSSVTTAGVGDTFWYYLEVENSGSDDATNVIVLDVLPPEIEYIGQVGTDGTYNWNTSLWEVGDIPSGSTASIDILVQVDTDGMIVNNAEVIFATESDSDSTPDNADPLEDDYGTAIVNAGTYNVDLELTKTVNTTNATVGDKVVYTISVSNFSDEIATGVEVTDLLPECVEFISAVPSTGEWSSANASDISSVPSTGLWASAAATDSNFGGTWMLNHIDPNSTATIDICANVICVGEVTNIAEITDGDQADDDSIPANGDPNEDDIDTATFTSEAIDLSLTKTVSNDTVELGDNFWYYITVTNGDYSTATNVEVYDLLPEGINYMGQVVSTGFYDWNTGIWDIPTIAPNSSATLSILVGLIQDVSVENTAQVINADQTDIDSTPGNNNPNEDDQDSVWINGTTIDLELDKSVSETNVAVGDSVIYTLTLINNGSADATNVCVEDLLPSGVNLISASPSSGTWTSSINTDEAVSFAGKWTVNHLSPGDTTTIDITVEVAEEGEIKNVAEVVAADQDDTDSTPDNNEPAEDDQDGITIGGSNSDLELSKSVNISSVTVGQTVEYTIVVENNGSATATAIAVRDVLPAGLSYVSATPSFGSYDSGTGIWNFASLAGGNTAILVIQATVENTGVIVNTAEIINNDTPDSDSTPNNNDPNEDDQDSAVIYSNETTVDLSLTKESNVTQTLVGGSFLYTITVSNDGILGATNVVVQDLLPANVTYLGDVPSQGSYNNISGNWFVGVLNGGETATLNIVVEATQIGTFINTAQITGLDQTDVDSTPGNNIENEDDQQSVAVEIIPSGGGDLIDLELNKASATGGTVNVGDDVTYYLSVTNTGDITATGVSVLDVLPNSMTFVSASPNDYDEVSGIWNIGSVGVGETVNLAITVQILQAGTILNTAQVLTADQADADSTPNNGIPNEDDQDHDVFVSVGSIGVCDTLIDCGTSYACTAPLTPLPICPDFCEVPNPLILEAISTYHCSISLNGSCITYTPLPSMELIGQDQVTITAQDPVTGYCYVTEVIVTIGECQPDCDAIAGATLPNALEYCTNDIIQVDFSQESTVPDGFIQAYILASGNDLVIEQINNNNIFVADEVGVFSIHSFVFDPASGILNNITTGTTTIYDLNALLINGGGDTCGDVVVECTQYEVTECNNTCDADSGTIEIDGDENCVNDYLTASTVVAPVVPDNYSVFYLLATGNDDTVIGISPSPSFLINEEGEYSIHILVAEQDALGAELPLNIGVTTISDLNALLEQGGGDICGSLQLVGTEVQVIDCNNICEADAGTISYEGMDTVCTTEFITAISTDIVEPDGFATTYLLSQGNSQIIVQLGNNPEFSAPTEGLFQVHTFVYNPLTLGVNDISFGITTISELDAMLEDICGDITTQGAAFYAEECDEECEVSAGDLALDNSTGCIGDTIIAFPSDMVPPPAEYELIYILTSGSSFIIEQVSNSPEFIINDIGDYTLHTLVYDPSTLDLSTIELGVTTALSINEELVQGGGRICAALLLDGPEVSIEDCGTGGGCEATTGGLVVSSENVCLGESATASFTTIPNVPSGFQVIYLLSENEVITGVNTVAEFTPAEEGIYTIHTLVFNPITLDLSTIVLGTTEIDDINETLVQGGGDICAALLADSGVSFEVEDCGTGGDCEATTGGLVVSSENVCLGESTTASFTTIPNVPSGFQVMYLLSENEVIIGVNTVAEFTPSEEGIYTIHTLVYDPNTLSLSDVVLGGNTIGDINETLVQGGGDICAALLADSGVSFEVEDCGTGGGCEATTGGLVVSSENVCLGESATASFTTIPNVPSGFQVIYLLSENEVITGVNTVAEFTPSEEGIYTIHTLVYDPSTLDLSTIALGTTEIDDINETLVQGGGDICAALLADSGVSFEVEDCNGGDDCLADAGSLQVTSPDVCIDSEITTTFLEVPTVPSGYQVIYLLTEGSSLVIEQVSSTPSFTMNSTGDYTIHTLVFDPATLNLSIINLGVTTGYDLDGLLTQGGGDICGALLLEGASITIDECEGGCDDTPIYDCTTPQTPITICPDFCEFEEGTYSITNGFSAYDCSITILSDDCIRYTPLPGYTGTDLITLIACNNVNVCDTVYAYITTAEDCTGPDNIDPVANNDFVASDDVVDIDVLANDTDANNDDLIICNYTEPTSGTLVFNGDDFTYIPEADCSGIITFTYTVCDGNGGSDIGNVTINCDDNGGGNSDPIAVNDIVNTNGEAVSIDVTLNDSDPDGDNIIICSFTEPQTGILTLNGNTFTYIPATDCNGTQTFTYTICDGNNGSSTATVSINCGDINPMNTDPVANDDTVTTDGETISIDVLDNDTDADGDDLIVCSYTEPSQGTLTLNGSSFTYIPNSDCVGTDTFTYTVCDGNGGSDTATVTVDCGNNGGGNNNPVAVDDIVITTVGTTTYIDALANDYDIDGDLFVICDYFQPTNGSVTVERNEFVYVPNESFIGTDTFIYIICDINNGSSEFASVIITVGEESNQAPIAVDDTSSSDGSEIMIDVTANDSDPDGDVFVVCNFTQPENGEVILIGNELSYTPNDGFEGTDTFTYVICDTNGNSDEATVTVQVTQIVTNTDPVAEDDNVTSTGDSVTIDVLSNDSDADGDDLQICGTPGLPMNGTITQVGNTFIYTPNSGFIGEDSFVYIVCDGNGGSDIATVFITIENNNEVIANDDNYSAIDILEADINVLNNDDIPAGCTPEVTIVSNPANGTATVNTDGSIHYIPELGFDGLVTIQYSACCDDNCDIAILTISVTSVECDFSSLRIPTGFSPNNDGINDRFVIEGLDNQCFTGKQANIIVFNRWGNAVYRSPSYGDERPWDGTYKDTQKQVPDGTYFYIMDVEVEGQILKKSGYIEIRK